MSPAKDHFKRDVCILVLLAALFGFGFTGYKFYQDRAVKQYLNSPAHAQAIAMLPQKNATNAGVQIIPDANSRIVMLQVFVNTQAEFDQVLKASKRPNRPAIERIITIWQGTNYEF